MAYPWSVYKTWVTGEVLTAGDLNNSFTTVVTNTVPTSIDDYSTNVTQMQTSTDPYPAASESLATTIAGELERIRYLIAQITGEAQWYIDPATTLTAIKNSTLTIAGAKTFSSAVTINPTTNQLVLGVTNTTTISSTAPAASRVYTIPDAGSNVEFVMAGGTQTIAGAKTFSDPITQNDTSNQIVLGLTNTTTISATAPSASRVVTIPDPGGDASFVMTEGTQTINGAKTFGSAIITSAVNNTAGVDIQGSNTNDSASAGYVGEYVESVISTFTNLPATGNFGDLTSISLTAGDWEVSVNAEFQRNGGTWATVQVGISSTAGNSTTGLTRGDNRLLNSWASSSSTPENSSIAIVGYRVSLTSTTTYYLKYSGSYSAGTPQAVGRISARRLR